MNRQPILWKTAQALRAYGYSERSIREITGASRRQIVRHHALYDFRFLDQKDEGWKRGGGGAPNML